MASGRSCKYSLVGEENGSITLESSLVLPGVMIVTFALILLALTIADRTAHYYTVAITGERAAFAWPHAAAAIRTGGYPPGAYDGLYWRLKDDAMVAGLLGWALDENSGPEIRFGGNGSAEEAGGLGDSLAAGKLRKSVSGVPAGTRGIIAYRNRIWLREVEIAADGAAAPDPLRRLWPLLSPVASASVTAAVVEPAEWMRTFELVRYYRARMQQRGQEGEDYRSQAAAVLERKR